MNDKFWKELHEMFTNEELNLSDKYSKLFKVVDLVNQSIDLNKKQNEVSEELTTLGSDKKEK